MVAMWIRMGHAPPGASKQNAGKAGIEGSGAHLDILKRVRTEERAMSPSKVNARRARGRGLDSIRSPVRRSWGRLVSRDSAGGGTGVKQAAAAVRSRRRSGQMSIDPVGTCLSLRGLRPPLGRSLTATGRIEPKSCARPIEFTPGMARRRLHSIDGRVEGAWVGVDLACFGPRSPPRRSSYLALAVPGSSVVTDPPVRLVSRRHVHDQIGAFGRVRRSRRVSGVVDWESIWIDFEIEDRGV